MGAFLNDRRAFAIVFANDHQHTAFDTGGRQIAQRIGGHVGAHNRFPSDGTAQRIVNGRTQHGRSRGFVGTGFDIHTELLHVVFGLHHHIEQMRHRCTLVATDIRHARLQQRFGDGQDAFTVKGFACAHAQHLNLFAE